MTYYTEYHDTLFLAFLHDPRDSSLRLKDMGEKYLNIPATEKEEVDKWVEDNLGKEFGNRNGKFSKDNPTGKYICYTPLKLQSKYAIRDVDLTWKMFKFLYKKVFETFGMPLSAYHRELKCMPIFVNTMSREGIRVDVKALKKDVPNWHQEIADLEKFIKKKLKVKDPEFKVSSGHQLADALDKADKVSDWELTPKGKRSTKRENLIMHCTDQKLVDALSRHGILTTYTGTFGDHWLDCGEKYGRLYPTFNQVRNPNQSGGIGGTRTGRPSSNKPNFLNVPKNPEDPKKPYTKGLPALRKYIIPDEGCVFLDRDYSQQELRILAHYEDGEFAKMYQDDPFMDAHDAVGDIVYNATGVRYERRYIKDTNFGILYGMGIAKMALKMDLGEEETKALRLSIKKSIPGIKAIDDVLRKLDRQNEPFVTWGGRFYWTEEPKMIQGRLRDFVYKNMNILIQGSAADATKEAMIRVHEACDKSRLSLQVYDQILNNSQKGYEKDQMIKMRDAMESLEFDVPMLSDGDIGRKNWGELKKFEPKRVDVPW